MSDLKTTKIVGRLSHVGHTIYIFNEYGYEINVTKYLSGYAGKRVKLTIEEVEE